MLNHRLVHGSAASGATINRASGRPCSVTNRSTMVSNSATISAVLAIGNCSRSATWTAVLLPWLGGDRRQRPHGPSARARRRRWPSSQSFEAGCPLGSTTVALRRGWPPNGRLICPNCSRVTDISCRTTPLRPQLHIELHWPTSLRKRLGPTNPAARQPCKNHAGAVR